MDVTVFSYPTGDPVLIDKIVNEFLSQGKFDKLRKECMADADTKPAYQNLQQRVESTVSQFLKKQVWKPDLNKNQLRDSLRKHILESGFLDAGINRIVDQIVNPNVLATVFMPEVEEVVYSYLSIPKPIDKSQKQCDVSVTSLANINAKPEVAQDTNIKEETDQDHIRLALTNEEQTNFTSEKNKNDDISDKKLSKLSSGSTPELQAEIISKGVEGEIKSEMEQSVPEFEYDNTVKEDAKLETKEIMQEEEIDSNNKYFTEKMELPSDESQDSLSRIGVERLRISESDGVNAPDSDASLPLEINEKSMSDSRESDDSIMNKMSPISQGHVSPEDMLIVEEEKEEKKPLTFIGRIPKIKKDDSESSKSSKKEDAQKKERLNVKSIYSSDESDSSKQSFGKTDSDDRKIKDAKKEISKEKTSRSSEKGDKNERKHHKDIEDKKKKNDHHKSSSTDRKSHSKDTKSRESKSKSGKDEKDKNHARSSDGHREKSRDKNSSSSDKKSSSSSHSRSKSSSHHKSMHKSVNHDKEHHRDNSKSRDKERSRHDKKERDKRDFDKRKKDEEKRKKNKNVDDHGKERNKRDDRRSTDRDSNERERDKTKETSSNRVHSESKKKDKDYKADDTKKEKNQREESDKKEEKCFSCESNIDYTEGNSNNNYKCADDSENKTIVNRYVYNGDKESMTKNFGNIQNESPCDENKLNRKFSNFNRNDYNIGFNTIIQDCMKKDEENGRNEWYKLRDSIYSEQGMISDKNQTLKEKSGTNEFQKSWLQNPLKDDIRRESRDYVNAQSNGLDFANLHKLGILTEIDFPKIIDDFYVKFDSTGFRYFEDWETSKLDCEEDFKEYIDDAEKDLSLLSDDGSDYENFYDHLKSEKYQSEVLANSIIGLSNFEDNLMFDPVTCNFYKWTNNKFYKKFRKNNSFIKNRSNKSNLIVKDSPSTAKVNVQLTTGRSDFVKNSPENKSDLKKVQDLITCDHLASNNLIYEDEMHSMAEKNKENQRRNKKGRKNLKLFNGYHRKIGLTFKYGREQHKFVQRRKKYFWGKSREKSMSAANEAKISYSSHGEIDMNGIKSKNFQSSYDLRELNSINDVRNPSSNGDKFSAKADVLPASDGVIMDILSENQNNSQDSSSIASNFDVHSSVNFNSKTALPKPATNKDSIEMDVDSFETVSNNCREAVFQNCIVSEDTSDCSDANGDDSPVGAVGYEESEIFENGSEEIVEELVIAGESFPGHGEIIEIGENCFAQELSLEEGDSAQFEIETVNPMEVNSESDADVDNAEMRSGDEEAEVGAAAEETVVEEQGCETNAEPEMGGNSLSSDTEASSLVPGEDSKNDAISDVGNERDCEENGKEAIDEGPGLKDWKSFRSGSSEEGDSAKGNLSRSLVDGALVDDQGSKVTPKMDVEAKIRLYHIQSLRRSKLAGDTQKTCILARIPPGRKDEFKEEEQEDDSNGNGQLSPKTDPGGVNDVSRKKKKIGLRLGLPRPKPKTDKCENSDLNKINIQCRKKINENFDLPLSPESDDSTFSNTGIELQRKNLIKRTTDVYSSTISESPNKKLKDFKRALNQKYESQDLYKPRPFSAGSKSRGRSLGVEDNLSKIDSRSK